MIPAPIVFILILTALSIGILTGALVIDSALKRQNRRQRQYLTRLQGDLATLSASLENDGVRAGIDTGKDYVVMRVQSTLDDVRSEL